MKINNKSLLKCKLCTFRVLSAVLCLCSREANLQLLLPLSVHTRHVSCKEKNKVETMNWWLYCVSELTLGGGDTKRNYFVYLVFHARCLDFLCLRAPEAADASEDLSAFPRLQLLPGNRVCSTSPVCFFRAAVLMTASPLQPWGIPVHRGRIFRHPTLKSPSF